MQNKRLKPLVGTKGKRERGKKRKIKSKKAFPPDIPGTPAAPAGS